jgi:hypothetical protein
MTIISFFLQEKIEKRINLRQLENFLVEDCPLFQDLKEKVFFFYDIEQNKM